jgi:hypothetical protein
MSTDLDYARMSDAYVRGINDGQNLEREGRSVELIVAFLIGITLGALASVWIIDQVSSHG